MCVCRGAVGLRGCFFCSKRRTDKEKEFHLDFLKAPLGIKHGEKLPQKLTKKRERLCLGTKHQELGAWFESLTEFLRQDCV